MPHGKDYIPSKDAEFDRFFKNVCDYTTQKTSGSHPEWDHIHPDAISGLQTAYADWHAAWEKAQSGHNSDDIREKNRIRPEKEHVLREFIQRYLKYAPVTSHDRDQMGIANRDSIKTSIGKPAEHVLLLIEPSHVREHKITWEVEETNSRAKPYGYDGVVLVKKILEPGESVPTDPETLGASQLLTKNHVIMEFTAADQGKRCAYAACWQNGKGEKGPWSDIVVVVIA